MRNLDGKVAIVTGGTGGIGAGVALELAVRGALVVISGRSEAKAETVLRQIRQSGGEGDFIAGDVRSKADMDSLAAEAARRHGGIDILVANAGGKDDEGRPPDVRGPFGDIDLARVCAVVAENTAAKLLPVQSALPFMRRRGGVRDFRRRPRADADADGCCHFRRRADQRQQGAVDGTRARSHPGQPRLRDGGARQPFLERCL